MTEIAALSRGDGVFATPILDAVDPRVHRSLDNDAVHDPQGSVNPRVSGEEGPRDFV